VCRGGGGTGAVTGRAEPRSAHPCRTGSLVGASSPGHAVGFGGHNGGGEGVVGSQAGCPWGRWRDQVQTLREGPGWLSDTDVRGSPPIAMVKYRDWVPKAGTERTPAAGCTVKAGSRPPAAMVTCAAKVDGHPHMPARIPSHPAGCHGRSRAGAPLAGPFPGTGEGAGGGGAGTRGKMVGDLEARTFKASPLVLVTFMMRSSWVASTALNTKLRKGAGSREHGTT
jgi:hypothetical protein